MNKQAKQIQEKIEKNYLVKQRSNSSNSTSNKDNSFTIETPYGPLTIDDSNIKKDGMRAKIIETNGLFSQMLPNRQAKLEETKILSKLPTINAVIKKQKSNTPKPDVEQETETNDGLDQANERILEIIDYNGFSSLLSRAIQIKNQIGRVIFLPTFDSEDEIPIVYLATSAQLTIKGDKIQKATTWFEVQTAPEYIFVEETRDKEKIERKGWKEKEGKTFDSENLKETAEEISDKELEDLGYAKEFLHELGITPIVVLENLPNGMEKRGRVDWFGAEGLVKEIDFLMTTLSYQANYLLPNLQVYGGRAASTNSQNDTTSKTQEDMINLNPITNIQGTDDVNKNFIDPNVDLTKIRDIIKFKMSELDKYMGGDEATSDKGTANEHNEERAQAAQPYTRIFNAKGRLIKDALRDLVLMLLSMDQKGSFKQDNMEIETQLPSHNTAHTPTEISLFAELVEKGLITRSKFQREQLQMGASEIEQEEVELKEKEEQQREDKKEQFEALKNSNDEDSKEEEDAEDNKEE